MHNTKYSAINRFFLGIAAIIVALVFFYGLNHLVMAMQGLPLNLDMTPTS